MPPLVHVVLLNWNNLPDTLACVESVERSNHPRLRIVVVDNGSRDGSAEALPRLGGRADVILLPENTGFAGGCNRGIAHALERGADYVWFLNTDATVEPDALGLLVAAAEADPAIGLVAPLVLEERGSGRASVVCGRFDRRSLVFDYTDDPEQAAAWMCDRPDEVVLMGSALLTRVALLERIGGFDETMFAYWEDVDLSIRSSLAGARNILCPEARAYHSTRQFGTAASTAKPHSYYYMARNERALLRKHGSGRAAARAMFWSFLRQLRLLERMAPDRAAAEAILAGLWHGWTGRGGAYDPAFRMPWPLRAVLRRNPRALRHLLERGRSG